MRWGKLRLAVLAAIVVTFTAGQYPAHSLGIQEIAKAQQSSGEKREISGQFDKSPIKARFFLSLAGLVVFFGFGLWGGRDIYNNRRRRGWVLITVGGSFWLGSFGLFWLSRFAWTWGWWL